ncbi:MAG: YdcF family protein [Prevotella sp.]|nr:YdcF family protein [Prevotella sp.]
MKILICSPAFYIFLLVAAAYLCRRHKRWKWTFAGLAVFAAFFFSMEPIYDIAANKWSEGYPWTVKPGKTYQYGIVLGGCSYWDWERNRPEFGGNADRLTEGIQLYHKGIIRKLVIASDGSIIQRDDTTKQSGNPKAMTDYLVRFGIPREDIILETKATTTHENAVYIKQMLDSQAKSRVDSIRSLPIGRAGVGLQGRPFLLITSSTHMRRSLMAFRQEGITADPYVTDCVVKVKDKEGRWLPSLHTVKDWQSLLHEIIGYAVYRLRW